MERANDGAFVGPVLLAVILVGLLAQRRGSTAGRRATSGGRWGSASEFHAIPPDGRALSPRCAPFRVAVALGGRSGRGGVRRTCSGTAGTLKAGVMLVFATIGLSMVVLSGWAGQVSLGQMAFVGRRRSGGRVGDRRPRRSTR